jgi:hypothetical protein
VFLLKQLHNFLVLQFFRAVLVENAEPIGPDFAGLCFDGFVAGAFVDARFVHVWEPAAKGAAHAWLPEDHDFGSVAQEGMWGSGAGF